MSSVKSVSGKPSGRPSGSSRTKQAILDTARLLFSKQGFERTTMRQIAAEANVDPSLIVHYYSTKQQLFVEGMLPLFEGPKLLSQALVGERNLIGERLAKLFVQLINDPTARTLLLGIIRSASSDEQAASMMRTFVQDRMVDTLQQHMSSPHAKLNSNLLGSHLIGIVIARYIVKTEPLASASESALVTLLASKLQAYFE